MSYDNLHLAGLWRGFETQIPESRKRLLRRGLDVAYLDQLTRPERRSMFYAAHALVNAERELNNQPLVYPREMVASCSLAPELMYKLSLVAG